jgi:hypothetical protein
MVSGDTLAISQDVSTNTIDEKASKAHWKSRSNRREANKRIGLQVPNQTLESKEPTTSRTKRSRKKYLTNTRVTRERLSTYQEDVDWKTQYVKGCGLTIGIACDLNPLLVSWRRERTENTVILRTERDCAVNISEVAVLLRGKVKTSWHSIRAL